MTAGTSDNCADGCPAAVNDLLNGCHTFPRPVDIVVSPGQVGDWELAAQIEAYEGKCLLSDYSTSHIYFMTTLSRLDEMLTITSFL